MNDAPMKVDSSLESLVGQVADEFLRRQREGEHPEVEGYVTCHPEAADVLRPVLTSLRLLDLSKVDCVSSPGGAASAEVAGTLGDYRILREVGRGGMGVVYEAVQVSLGRRVALKVLPFAAALDAKQLQRFKYEAQAAAQLHHTNIVPVYAVGSERGVHFYAMQYIDGQTLAAVLTDLRRLAGLDASGTAAPEGSRLSVADELVSGRDAPPRAGAQGGQQTEAAPPGQVAETPRPRAAAATEHSGQDPAFFRSIAQMGVQAAEALEHAHQFGVVHRDIKPGNLLRDGGGNLWVTDFGLAQVRSEAGLTLTGDLVGTVRYMSPEQALGRRGLVDQRTDLYSLGVTLYELLTLEPAFGGNDRQELLRRIAVEEPRPPRRLNRAVPAELETVVLKAMAKDPAERYAGGRELADDLRRFLEDRPVRARRPSLWRRARQWARRHRPLVVTVSVSAAAALAVAVVLLAVANLQIRAKEAQKAAALEAEAAQHRRAEGNLKLALEAMDEVFLKPVEEEVSRKELPRHAPLVPQELDRLGRPPGEAYRPSITFRALTPQELDRLDRHLLQKGLEFYEKFAQANSTDPLLRAETGKAYQRVGSLRLVLGQFAEAGAAFRRSLLILEELAEEFPAVPEYRRTLVNSYQWLGHVLRITGRGREAEVFFRKSVAVSRQLVAEFPAVAGYRGHLCDACRALGDFLKEERRHPEAEQAYRWALDVARQLVAEFPAVAAVYREHVYFADHSLGDLFIEDDRYAEAEEPYRQALELARQLAADSPGVLAHRHKQVVNLEGRAFCLIHLGRPAEAEQPFNEALDLSRQLAQDFPTVAEHRVHVCLGYRFVGDVLTRDPRRRPEAEQAYRQALDLYRQLAADIPDAADRRRDLPVSQTSLVRLLLHVGRLAEAEQTYRQSIPLVEKLAAKFPDESAHRHLLAADHVGLGDVLWLAGRFEEAAGEYSLALETEPDSAEAQWKLAWFLSNCARARYRNPHRAIELAKKASAKAPDVHSWKTLGLAYYRTGDWDNAIACLTRAGDASYEGFPLAMAHWQRGNKEQARRWYERACWWMEEYKGGYSQEPGFYWEDEHRRLRAEAAAVLRIEDED